jgi:hypothetical protein
MIQSSKQKHGREKNKKTALEKDNSQDSVVVEKIQRTVIDLSPRSYFTSTYREAEAYKKALFERNEEVIGFFPFRYDTTSEARQSFLGVLELLLTEHASLFHPNANKEKIVHELVALKDELVKRVPNSSLEILADAIDCLFYLLCFKESPGVSLLLFLQGGQKYRDRHLPETGIVGYRYFSHLPKGSRLVPSVLRNTTNPAEADTRLEVKLFLTSSSPAIPEITYFKERAGVLSASSGKSVKQEREEIELNRLFSCLHEFLELIYPNYPYVKENFFSVGKKDGSIKTFNKKFFLLGTAYTLERLIKLQKACDQLHTKLPAIDEEIKTTSAEEIEEKIKAWEKEYSPGLDDQLPVFGALIFEILHRLANKEPWKVGFIKRVIFVSNLARNVISVQLQELRKQIT